MFGWGCISLIIASLEYSPTKTHFLKQNDITIKNLMAHFCHEAENLGMPSTPSYWCSKQALQSESSLNGHGNRIPKF